MDAAVGDVHRWGRSLAEFDTDPVLKLGLKRVDETLKETLALVESRRARATAAKNEMYLVLSFFLVFQGGVMSLLASKANASKCNYAWYPAALSTVAFWAVVGVVHEKFRDYHDLKRKRQKAESAANELMLIIKNMMKLGKQFKFAETVPPQEVSEASTSELAAASPQPKGAENLWNATPLSDSESTSELAAASTSELAAASPQPEGAENLRNATPVSEARLADWWADTLFMQERHYSDVILFLSILFAIVFINCFHVC